MPGLADTIARLSALRGPVTSGLLRNGASRLRDLANFGTNPGALQAKMYIPDGPTGPMPLVVVLHGCHQTADDYDAGSGWSQLADRYGFALLLPQQQRRNNPNLCFNWFVPDDCRRDSGEALSIRQMVETTAQRHAIDPGRVFVTGLSAGGAMASVMLATYPEMFAGGAIIAGLPYGCAKTIPDAFDRMRGIGMPGEAELSALVRGASRHEGAWPTISIWHGSRDATVNPTNADAIIAQWRALHGVNAEPSRTDAVDGYPRRVWRNAEGREIIEEYCITGMGHGTPLETCGSEGCGTSGAYMLEANISSTRHICRFWGLAPQNEAGRSEAADMHCGPVPVPSTTRLEGARSTDGGDRLGNRPPTGGGVSQVIEDALRAAGLLR